MTRRVGIVENNLRVVWRGSQQVTYFVCIIMYMFMHVKKWWNCGWRWDKIKTILHYFFSKFYFKSSFTWIRETAKEREEVGFGGKVFTETINVE